MTKQRFTIARILGIPIRLDITWFIVFALITWVMATSYYPLQIQGATSGLYWSLGVLTALLLFTSVLLHELGHSVLARHYHIEVRSITLFFFGGLAEIAHEPAKASQEFWIALAGPAVSFGLAVIFFFLRYLVLPFAPIFALVEYVALINGMLAVFNLTPGFPLDGGRVFRSIVWAITHNFSKATQIAANVGKGIAALFILLGVYMVFTRDLGGGLWLGFMGWFLMTAASSQLQQQQTQDILTEQQVGQVMTRNYVSIPPEMTLQQLLNGFMLLDARRNYIVERDGQIEGILSINAIRNLPRDRWAFTTVGQVMSPLAEAIPVQPDTRLWNAMEEMDRYGLNFLPVSMDGQTVGLLSRESILNYLHTIQELGLRKPNQASGVGD